MTIKITGFTTLTVILLTSALTGCGNNPVIFDPQESQAMNIARAGGIDYRLKDTEIPKDTVADIRDTQGYAFAMAASGYHAPVHSLSGGQTAVMNLAASMLAPEAQSTRNSLFAWMPKELVGKDENAIDKLSDLLIEASSKMAMEIGYDPLHVYGRDSKAYPAVGFLVKGRDKDDRCRNNNVSGR